MIRSQSSQNPIFSENPTNITCHIYILYILLCVYKSQNIDELFINLKHSLSKIYHCIFDWSITLEIHLWGFRQLQFFTPMYVGKAVFR